MYQKLQMIRLDLTQLGGNWIDLNYSISINATFCFCVLFFFYCGCFSLFVLCGFHCFIFIFLVCFVFFCICTTNLWCYVRTHFCVSLGLFFFWIGFLRLCIFMFCVCLFWNRFLLLDIICHFHGVISIFFSFCFVCLSVCYQFKSIQFLFVDNEWNFFDS